MTNKYLTKAASGYNQIPPSYGPGRANYNVNYNVNPYQDAMNERQLSYMSDADEGNSVLNTYGYKPVFEANPAHAREASRVIDADIDAHYRPHHDSSAAWGGLGGTLAGAGVGFGTAAALAGKGFAAPAGVLAGLGAGVLAGKGIYNHLYSDDRKAEDDARMAEKNKYLQGILSKYEKY